MSSRLVIRCLPVIQVVVLVIICTGCNPSKKSIALNSAPQTSGTQHRHNPYPAIQQKYFTHVWAGTQWCNGDTTGADFQLAITSKDSVNVYVEGFNNSKTAVEGKVRGYLVIIEPQKVTLPTGNRIVAGTFALSNDHDILRGYYTLQTNGVTDSCKVAFRTVK